MTSIDELRASLTAHADTLDAEISGVPHAGRKAALDGRIRRARNRRRAALAGGTAAVVLAAGGVYAAVSAPATRHSSSPLIAGHTLDQHVTVTGFEYALASSAQSTPGQQRFTVHLPKVGPDRVVRLLGTGLGAGTATLRDQDQDRDLARVGGDVGEAAPVPVDSSRHDVSVVLHDAGEHAQVGIAVYGRDDASATGPDDGHAIFRDQVADDRLVGGGFGTSPTLTQRLPIVLDQPLTAWRLADECTIFGTHVPDGLMLDERIDGKPFGGSGCWTEAEDSDEGEVDAGTSGGQPSHWGLARGKHWIDLRIVDRDGHTARLDNEVSFGAAIYSVGEQTTVRGMPVDHRIEANGRDWVLDQTIPADNAQITGPAYVRAIVGAGDWQMVGQHLTAGDRDMVISSTSNRTGGPGEPALGEVLAGSTYRFWLKHPHDPSAKATILVYRPAG